jgi:LysR family cyn operon transcriptional activator
MPITLDGLRCFCGVVDTGSFRRAGEKLHRSQPAISQQIKSLERAVRQPLLDRKTGAPTPVGQLLYARACRLLLDADAMAREVADFDTSAVQEVRVGASDTTALYLLPPIVRAFSAQSPDTRIIMQTRSSDQIAATVLAGDLDLGVVTLPVNHADLVETPLLEEELVYVCAKGSPFAARPKRLDDLAETPLVLLDRTTRTGDLLHTHFRTEGFTPTTILDSGSFEVIKRYVAEGLGASFLPAYVVTEHDPQFVTHRVPGLPEVTIGAVWRKEGYQSRAAKTFLTFLRGRGQNVK